MLRKLMGALLTAAALSLVACSDGSSGGSSDGSVSKPDTTTVTTTTQAGTFGGTKIEFARTSDEKEGSIKVGDTERTWKMDDSGKITVYDSDKTTILYTFELDETGGIKQDSVKNSSGSKIEATVEKPKTETNETSLAKCWIKKELEYSGNGYEEYECADEYIYLSNGKFEWYNWKGKDKKYNKDFDGTYTVSGNEITLTVIVPEDYEEVGIKKGDKMDQIYTITGGEMKFKESRLNGKAEPEEEGDDEEILKASDSAPAEPYYEYYKNGMAISKDDFFSGLYGSGSGFGNEPSEETSLAKCWIKKELEYSGNGYEKYEYADEYIYLSDGMFGWYHWEKDNNKYNKDFDGTYTVNGNEITLTVGEQSKIYEILGAEMVSGDDIFIKAGDNAPADDSMPYYEYYKDGMEISETEFNSGTSSGSN